jgi:hypothetical protein
MNSSTVIDTFTEYCSGKVPLAYFYFDFRNAQQCTLERMLRSFVAQLHQTFESWGETKTHPALLALFKRSRTGVYSPSVADWMEVLIAMLEGCEEAYLLAEGLDECRQKDWTGITTFVETIKSRKHIRLIVSSSTSVSNQSLSEALRNAGLLERDVSNEKGTKDDFDKAIMLTMDRDRRYDKFKQDGKELIRDELKNRCES